MGNTPPFLAPNNYPHQITFAEAEHRIAWLRDWIGPQRLQKSIDEYHSDNRQAQGVRALRMKQRQPLVEAFADYLARTVDGSPLDNFSDSLRDLGATAAIAYAIAPTIPGDLADHQRHKLLNLDGQLHPLLLEWTTAGQIVRANCADLAWFPLGADSKRLPEFVARSPRTGVECEFECKYQTANINQLLGSYEADTLAQELIDLAGSANLCGDISLSLAGEERQNTREAHKALMEHIAAIRPAQLFAGEGCLDLIDGASLAWDLKTRNGTHQSRNAWINHVLSRSDPTTRPYAKHFGSGLQPVDALNVYIKAPVKSEEQFSADLWERKFKEAAEKLSGERGGIIVMEWESQSDPSVFRDAGLFQNLLTETYRQYRHVARIVMRCRPRSTPPGGAWDNSVEAYVTQSSVTCFPEALEFMNLDIHY